MDKRKSVGKCWFVGGGRLFGNNQRIRRCDGELSGNRRRHVGHESLVDERSRAGLGHSHRPARYLRSPSGLERATSRAVVRRDGQGRPGRTPQSGRPRQGDCWDRPFGADARAGRDRCGGQTVAAEHYLERSTNRRRGGRNRAWRRRPDPMPTRSACQRRDVSGC